MGLLQKRKIFWCQHEPVHKWEKMVDAQGTPFNLLKEYYRNPPLYAFELQEWARLTFLQNTLQEPPQNQPVLAQIWERCIFSGEVFVAAGDFLTPLQVTINKGWQEFIWNLEYVGPMRIRPNAIIYLDVAPDICLARIRSRNRKGEENITRGYLERLEAEYQKWLTGMKQKGVQIANINGELSPEEVARRVERCVRSLISSETLTHPLSVAKPLGETQ
jgi:deoxyadenosine/deoxycytidine kinase